MRRRGGLASHRRLQNIELGLARPTRGPQALAELAPAAYKTLNREGLLDALRAVERNGDVRVEMATLARLCDLTGTGVPERPGADSARETVISLGVSLVLLRLLAAEPVAPSSARSESRAPEQRNESLFMLRELCFTQPGFAESLANHPYAIQRCFELMARGPALPPGRPPQLAARAVLSPPARGLTAVAPYLHQGSSLTFENAVGLAEELLAVSDSTFLLDSVPNIAGLFRGMSREELALFCRVLALMVFQQEARYPPPARTSCPGAVRGYSSGDPRGAPWFCQPRARQACGYCRAFRGCGTHRATG